MPEASSRVVAAASAEGLRRYRQSLVEDISGGVVDLAELVGDPRAGQVKVVVLAQAVPGVGKVRSRRALAEVGVAEGTRWGELPASVATAVVDALARAATGDGA